MLVSDEQKKYISNKLGISPLELNKQLGSQLGVSWQEMIPLSGVVREGSIQFSIVNKRKSIKDMRKTFLRNVELNNVERFTDKTVKELVTLKKSKDGKKKYLNVKYQATNKLFKNIHVMMDVDETLELTGSVAQ